MSLENINIDGKEYPVSGFSKNVQTLVAIYGKWATQLQDERLAVSKTEAAIKALDAELAQAVKAELETQANDAAEQK